MLSSLAINHKHHSQLVKDPELMQYFYVLNIICEFV